MNKTLKTLAARRSVLESLKVQGTALLARGNVSMEEFDSYKLVSEAVITGDVPVAVEGTVTEPVTVDDPDVCMELAVMEVDRQLEETEVEIENTGPIPPSDAVVSMDDDEAAEVDDLIDEAEELDALAEYGYAIQEDSGLEGGAAFESYKKLVIDCFKRADVSIESVEAAETIEAVVTEVEEVRDIAELVIEKVAEGTDPVSVESFSDSSIPLRAVVVRANTYTAIAKARKKETANVPA
jgi:hypothetical protein